LFFARIASADAILAKDRQNHRGYQALQFAGLFFAWRLGNYLGTTKLTWLVLALAAHSASRALALQLARSGPLLGNEGRQDSRYPAQQLADAIRHDWQDDTPCPLAFVALPSRQSSLRMV
jgi:hypothetical protein